MKRVIFAVIVAVVAVGVFSACAKKSGGNVIKVTFVEGGRPKGFRDASGKITGYDVEVFEELDKLWDDVTFEFELTDQSAMLLGVETGKYHAASDGLFKNPSREEKFLFPSENLCYSPLNLLVRSDSTINSLEDMKGKVFVPLPANWGNYYILKTYIDAHPEGNYTFNAIDSVVNADIARWVHDGLYDAYFGPTESFPSIKEELKLNIKITDTVYYEPTYPIFNKNSADLVTRWNAGIKVLKENGTLKRLTLKWFDADVFADQAAFIARSK